MVPSPTPPRPTRTPAAGQFDQAVTQALASFALVAFALAACAISWLVNDAPQLAAQLTAAVGAGEALADGGGGTQAAALALAPAATPPTGLDLFQMLRGPSLFRSNNF